MILRLEQASESSGGPHSKNFWFSAIGVGPHDLLFYKFPDNSDIAALGTILWEALIYRERDSIERRRLLLSEWCWNASIVAPVPAGWVSQLWDAETICGGEMTARSFLLFLSPHLPTLACLHLAGCIQGQVRGHIPRSSMLMWICLCEFCFVNIPPI